ncbi:MAG TPA: sigma-70 family RNA polymerase sigma factor [Pirellulaceae bacterium]|nr:sigma-70 family RNA polymerase sigma factor [Pirellulaceae bacterium]
MTDQAELIYERLLVVRAQAGDEAAFAELVERFSPRLRYFLRKLLGASCRERPPWRSDEAEDALQDVWLDVFRNLPRLADPQALVAWLYRIARDRAFGRLRKARRIEQQFDETLVVDTAAADEGDFSPEDAAHIHTALDELPPEQREVLVLRFLEDMSYEQIARVIGCQLGTVRSRIHYGKRALRGALEKDQSS